jgi:hypothetical protein
MGAVTLDVRFEDRVQRRQELFPVFEPPSLEQDARQRKGGSP